MLLSLLAALVADVDWKRHGHYFKLMGWWAGAVTFWVGLGLVVHYWK